ncbi:MAG: hypothetical protein IPP15_19270 [Saprospiraceae bacterium]|uniref:Uncharacterized protein n=1 Tax=Candidatus Opimibacter skivensis TaxID=2982028 RepID=A0A9D7XVA1_9BACT|nr:hypothetical protein [Candidatus Opimibacter skivensis]
MVILPYSDVELTNVLSNNYTPVSVISKKYHYIYFKDYLGPHGLQAKTILVEDDYVSKDFLHDYASYYAFCFEKYPKFCKRIHFFSESFNEDDFKKAMLSKGSEQEEIWNSYLGFIVVKPIPTKVVGFTVLKTFDSGADFGMRYFWGVRDYSIHLYGNELKLKSLAFQEQDSVLAACATTAIWSMLNKASIDFHTILKSPSQITKDADNVSPDGSRLFPNKGLNLLQICQAIFNSGLVSEVKQPDLEIRDASGNVAKFVSSLYLKKILNAYSAIGIPIILVINVPIGSERGLHAITVTGYKQNPPTLLPPQPEIGWLASNIEKLYAHDDQWGPFARIKFLNDYEIETPWTVFNSTNQPTLVTNIVVPVYPKVRISYEDIEVIVLGLDRILTFFFSTKIVADLVWDIKIDYSETFKKQLKQSILDPSEILNLLEKSMPKYLWIGTCYIGTFKVLEFSFDATDVNNGMIGEGIICYLEPSIRATLKTFLVANKSVLHSLFNHAASSNYYDFICDNI